MAEHADVVVVGVGLAGLCCARALARAGREPLVLERDDGIGGRVRTDRVDGFALDRGFQVLLTAYPECRAVLDYGALRLGAFEPGARIRAGGGWVRVADPRRRPLRALATLFAGVGPFGDKLRLLRLVRRARRGSLDDLFRRPATTTREALAGAGFGERMVERFFRPFLGGVFLDPELRTSSRMLEFVLRMFAEGVAALPAGGMGAIPEQIAAGLPGGTVRTGVPVTGVSARRVRTAAGEELVAEAVVVATDGSTAAGLLPGLPPPAFRGVTCLYFSAGEAPVREPVLLLDGEGRGPVANLCFPSRVAGGYAPEGRELVSATVLDPAGAEGRELEAAVRAQLRGWFGPVVDGWERLRTIRVPEALPVQTPDVLDPVGRPVVHGSGVYLCGDHRETGSIQGAMVSGRRAAEAALRGFGGSGDRA